MTKLLRVVILHPTSKKKYIAEFKLKICRLKKTRFGATGYGDYTLTGDKVKRASYRSRHKKDLRTGDPTRAGFLSYYILWGDSTSVRTNVASYKKRFNL